MIESVSALDYAVLVMVQSLQQPMLTFLIQFISFLGNPIFWFGVAAYYYWSNREEDSFYLMNLIALVAVSADVLKMAIARARPSGEEFKIIKGQFHSVMQNYSSNYSFPSGHSTMIGAATGYFYQYVKTWKKVIFIALILLIPFSRMYLGMHFLSDVLIGIVLGLGIGKFNDFLKDETEEKKINFARKKTRMILSIVFIIAAALLVIGSYLIGVVLLGFYLGLFLMKSFRLERDTDKKVKNVTGFIGLFALLVIIMNFKADYVIEVIIFFTAGIWVSLLNPLLNHKLIKA